MHYRPMTTGQILDNTFRSYRENFGAILTFTLLFQGVIMLILSVITLLTELSEYASLLFFLAPSMYGIYMFLFMPVYFGGVTHSVHCQLQGTKLSFKDLLKQFTPLVNKYASTNALFILALFILFLGFTIIMTALIVSLTVIPSNPQLLFFSALTAEPSAGMIAVFLLPLIIIMFLLVFLTWAPLLFPIVEFENIRNWAAIKRAISLAFRKIWRVLGIICLFGFIYLAINMAFIALTTVWVLFLPGGAQNFDSALFSAGFVLLYNMIYLIQAPLLPIFGVWLYLDICPRVGGEDLSLVLERNGDEENVLIT